MSRLDATFEALRARGDRALVAFFTAGDPTMEKTARLVIEAERRGADVIELGVPFSDPVADGPVNQRAGQRALAVGVAAFAETAGKVGVDGVIVVDLPPEESAELGRETHAAGVDLIHLVAPT